MGDVLITGATGFLGHECLQSILEDENVTSAIVLVRDPNKMPSRLEKSISKANSLGKTTELIIGDVRIPNLGLSKIDKRKLRKVRGIYHFAANVSLNSNGNFRDGNPIYDVNVNGTRNVRDLGFNSERLERFIHCSSAYIGSGLDLVPENWISESKKVRNDYEKSKWLAEEIIRDSPSGFPFVIIRPGILCLDDNNFADVPKQTIYSYSTTISKSIKKAKIDERIRVRGEQDSVLNILRISDFLHLFRAICESDNKENVYNFTSRTNLKVGDLISWIAEGLDRDLSIEYEFVDGSLSDAENYIEKNTAHFMPYLFGSVGKSWDTRNSERFRGPHLISENPDWIKSHLINYSKTLQNGNSK